MGGETRRGVALSFWCRRHDTRTYTERPVHWPWVYFPQCIGGWGSVLWGRGGARGEGVYIVRGSALPSMAPWGPPSVLSVWLVISSCRVYPRMRGQVGSCVYSLVASAVMVLFQFHDPQKHVVGGPAPPLLICSGLLLTFCRMAPAGGREYNAAPVGEAPFPDRWSATQFYANHIMCGVCVRACVRVRPPHPPPPSAVHNGCRWASLALTSTARHIFMADRVHNTTNSCVCARAWPPTRIYSGLFFWGGGRDVEPFACRFFRSVAHSSAGRKTSRAARQLLRSFLQPLFLFCSCFPVLTVCRRACTDLQGPRLSLSRCLVLYGSQNDSECVVLLFCRQSGSRLRLHGDIQSGGFGGIRTRPRRGASVCPTVLECS